MLTSILIKITRTFNIQPHTTKTQIQITCWNFRCSTLNSFCFVVLSCVLCCVVCCGSLEGYKITGNSQANTFLRIKEYTSVYTTCIYIYIYSYFHYIANKLVRVSKIKSNKQEFYTAVAIAVGWENERGSLFRKRQRHVPHW